MASTDGGWATRYREKWTWDKVTFGGHAVDCYPGGCSWRVYTKGDKIVREEQSALWSPTEPGVPDLNPMGCQKGACWSHCHYSPDRVTQPLKRVGERGKGQFEAVSWDEALGDIADAMLDAIEDQGVESIITLLIDELAFAGLIGSAGQLNRVRQGASEPGPFDPEVPGVQLEAP